MSLDLETLADQLLATVDRALAPVHTKLATLVAQLENLDRVARDLSIALGLDHDRITRLELPAPDPAAGLADLVDRALGPAYERVAATEARVEGVLHTLAGCEHGLQTVRDRLAGLEAPSSSSSLQDLSERLAVLQATVLALPSLTETVGTLRERVATLDARPLAPGPAGAPGVDGQPGKDGKDGTDGLGFEDLVAEYDRERTITISATRGQRTKLLHTIVLPLPIWRGVFLDGCTYQPGDLVRWARGVWICVRETTLKPNHVTRSPDGNAAGPQGKDYWQPFAEPGRDGKDGPAGPAGPAGRPGKDWQATFDEAHGGRP